MRRGVWVEHVVPLPGEYCQVCARPTAQRWIVLCGQPRRGVFGLAYLCTRHLRQLARSAMRASIRERLAKKRGKRKR